MSKHLGNESRWQLLLKQTLSLLATFYISYLFLHFVILELTPIENTLVIVAIIWAGHILLNSITIAITKKQTFGDVIFRLQYNSLTGKQPSSVAVSLFIRSFITTNVLYLLVCLNVQLKFSMDVLFGSFCLALFLLIFPFKRQNFQTLNLFDWVSGTRAM
ncbi:hypothetical protein [Thalassotalea sediminis]|uniref:hypothetical protein n=1 Tax=Thalassotalea sediminis TaxID=1759089 RepID=UPI0025723739|nr:hypothetical protein [Thalassotalea sediminis]